MGTCGRGLQIGHLGSNNNNFIIDYLRVFSLYPTNNWKIRWFEKRLFHLQNISLSMLSLQQGFAGLGQKLKMHKNMLKTFLQHIAVVLCKKQLEKTANIRKMRAF